ncbi:SNF2-related protein [Hymenobacter caeli]|uniref:DEAD/DEAH box helicase n=1 Tax=Hymenobacter caeli TaxID=2735894 RepID=A0ABX2FRQ5_9BACT|nr:hypothetical protein [Hymenobacter caeli]
MKVSSTEPFQIVYSLFEHEFLGHLFAAYLVQRGPKGQLTLLHQTASARNAPEFAGGLDAVDFELIDLCDQLQQEAVIKEFWPRKIAAADFFLKTYSPDKGDKPLQDAIGRYVQTRMAAVLARLHGKRVFIMGRDGEPTWREIALAPVPASVLFHFRRNDDGTHYFPTIQYQNQKLDFQYKGALLVCQQPAWLLLDGVLYSFRNEVDGRKLQPFLNKKFIVVPRQVEASYFQKFVAPLMEAFDVHARGVGFAVVTDRYRARPRLTFSDVPPAPAAAEGPERPVGPPRRGRVPQPKPAAAPSPDRLYFDLGFRYGEALVPFDPGKRVSVRLEQDADSYTFHRLLRSTDDERAAVAALAARGLALPEGRTALDRVAAFQWLHDHAEALAAEGFAVEPAAGASQPYFLGPVRVELGIQEAGDWFDVRGTVYFGDTAVPFIRLRGHILQRRREFRLPNGQVAIIPEAWFTDYLELFAFAEEKDDTLALRRHHLALVADLQSNELATVTMGRKLEKLRDFATVEDHPLPAGFRGELRPYQKAGYNWLRFVQDYHFGGCLADDMGLGKAQPLHANVLTPNGWQQMGALRIGDAVVNSQGRASTVTGIFPQGAKEIFRVTFTDDSTAECCADHLWAVQSAVQKYRGQAYAAKPLHELMGDLHDRHGNTKWFIPLVQPVALAAQPVPVDAYFLGLLLGDGYFRQHSIRLSTGDAEIVNYVAQELPPSLAMRRQGETCDYTFVGSAAGVANGLMRNIKALGLKGKGSKDKFVPEVYLCNDAATRLAVLQGLMDSDGYVSATGDVCQFTSISPALVAGVTFLTQSLGGTARQSSKTPTPTHRGERRTGQLAYTLTLSLPPQVQPFRLARKAALYRPKTKYRPYRGIKAIERVGTMPAQCIAVDAPDHLYVTDNFILTHNTIQALAMLQQRAESGAAQGAASLLALPTSLVYNWLNEAKKFTPGLRLLVYTGTYRTKDVGQFADYDVVLTSYGIVRLDAELLASYRFDYVILDESQAIKNPSSTTSQAVRQLRSRHRLILTGTPVENSTMDLWSQMSFINPGLLGTQAFFRKEFLKPIEQNRDEGRTRRLHALIKPFILRRHKEQVAKELPAKTEQLSYCEMTPEQAQAYEEAKSFYRNKILKNLDEHGAASTQFLLLQGLTRLRQMANHPHLADATYAHESGKLREVLRMVRNVVAEGHKVLVFSQFVQHLALVRAALDERQLPYAYLDGNTRDRAGEVARFQETDALQIFLISLKAGGVGLNLTAADYVFLLDPWWNPAVEAQAVDRAHRIGQQRPVFVYKFITQHTVEEKILALQQRKLNLVSELIATDEAVIKTLTRADIEELLG